MNAPYMLILEHNCVFISPWGKTWDLLVWDHKADYLYNEDWAVAKYSITRQGERKTLWWVIRKATVKSTVDIVYLSELRDLMTYSSYIPKYHVKQKASDFGVA